MPMTGIFSFSNNVFKRYLTQDCVLKGYITRKYNLLYASIWIGFTVSCTSVPFPCQPAHGWSPGQTIIKAIHHGNEGQHEGQYKLHVHLLPDTLVDLLFFFYSESEIMSFLMKRLLEKKPFENNVYTLPKTNF